MRFVASRHALPLILLLLSTFLSANAQDLAGLEQGIKPYGAYHGGDIDSVSMVNGGLSFQIPLISYPQRGGKLTVGFSLIYKNAMYTETDDCITNPRPRCIPTKFSYNLSYGGQYRTGGAATALTVMPDFYPTMDLHYVNSILAGMEIHESDGAVHLTDGSISMDATGFSYSYNPSSGAYGTGTLIDRHGTRYYYPYLSGGCCTPKYPGNINKIEDSNGNVLTPNFDPNNSQAITSWTDTINRTIPTGGTSTSNYSGCTGSQTTIAADLWTLPGPDGGTSQFKICYAQFPVEYTPPTCTANCTGLSGQGTQIQSIVLPNNTAWTFAFDTTGSLSTITLPTGGTISYTWNINAPLYCFGNGDILFNYEASVATRTVDADGSGGHTWKYALSWPTGSIQTIVTDPNLNDAVHTESLSGSCSGFETELDEYSGSHTSGRPPIRKTATVYNSHVDPLQNNLLINVVPLTITTTDVPTGKTSRIAKTL
jgi:hypothetical protein